MHLIFMILGVVWFPWAVVQPYRECRWCFAESTYHLEFSVVLPCGYRQIRHLSRTVHRDVRALCWELCQCPLLGKLSSYLVLVTHVR